MCSLIFLEDSFLPVFSGCCFIQLKIFYAWQVPSQACSRLSSHLSASMKSNTCLIFRKLVMNEHIIKMHLDFCMGFLPHLWRFREIMDIFDPYLSKVVVLHKLCQVCYPHPIYNAALQKNKTRFKSIHKSYNVPIKVIGRSFLNTSL